ncbi:MAG: YihA family ribosome biogenesis GTP-binding protein [Deltaproteobacteria bacterium]|nr:MAG: YihA family ribosome biogenesis GTP-binding protein [Deltaproteobacteria bacterium]
MEFLFIKSAVRPSQFPPPDRPEIAFAGRSNVGKSSLINRLVNSPKLARTSSRPGRTRAINFFSVGKNLCLTDLPGYGYAEVPLKLRRNWKVLIETYLRKRHNLKAVVVIIDIRRTLGQGDLELLHWLRSYEIDAIVVLTKADKVSKGKAKHHQDVISSQLMQEGFGQPISFSAKTGQGKQELWKAIEEKVRSAYSV